MDLFETYLTFLKTKDLQRRLREEEKKEASLKKQHPVREIPGKIGEKNEKV